MFTTTSKSPPGTLNDRNHRGVLNALASAALACIAIASSHVNAAAVITFTEINDGTAIQAVLSGTLDVNNAESTTEAWVFNQNPGPFQDDPDRGILVLDPNIGLQVVSSYGETGDDVLYYTLGVPTENTWANPFEVRGAHSGTEFLLNTGGQPGIGFNPNDLPATDGNNVYTLDATITLTFEGVNFVNFELIGATAGSEFVYTLLDSESNPLTETVTVRFETSQSQLAPVPLPASVLFLGASIGGFGLMGRLRRRKLNA